MSVQFGARHLERAMEELVVNPITRAIFAGRVAAGDVVTLKVAGSELEPVLCRSAAGLGSEAAEPAAVCTVPRLN